LEFKVNKNKNFENYFSVSNDEGFLAQVTACCAGLREP